MVNRGVKLNKITYQEEKTFDLDKKYLYLGKFSHDLKIYKEVFKVKLQLREYPDGEGYGTSDHYGYVFVITEIITRDYNVRVGDVLGTFPDLKNKVKEIKMKEDN